MENIPGIWYSREEKGITSWEDSRYPERPRKSLGEGGGSEKPSKPPPSTWWKVARMASIRGERQYRAAFYEEFLRGSCVVQRFINNQMGIIKVWIHL